MIAAAAAELIGLPGMVRQHLAGLHVGGNLGAQNERAKVVANADEVMVLDLPLGRIALAQVHHRLATLQT